MPHCPKSQDIRAQREPGQSGNPSGRPKGRSKDLDNFGDILMKEFFKTVPVSLVGKTVNKTQGEVLAMQMMKKAINGGTPRKGPIAAVHRTAHTREDTRRAGFSRASPARRSRCRDRS
jgi:hypothetical protein